MSNISVDNARMQQHVEAEKNPKPAEKEDQESFEAAMEEEAFVTGADMTEDGKELKELKEVGPEKKGQKPHAQETESGKETGLEGEEETKSTKLDELTALLSGREGMLKQFNKVDEGAQNVAAQKTSTASVEQLTTQLAERILVSQADAQKQEVRITVNNAILPQTEITIHRNDEGLLHVHLISDNQQSFQTLVEGQQSLQSLLAKQESGVVVSVSRGAESQAEDNNSQRRSRTFMEAQNKNADE